MPYEPRIVDIELTDLMTQLSALMLDGPKGVGKTTTAEQRSANIFRLDQEGAAAIVRADPSVIDESTGTVVVDEWQRVPQTWDYVRRQVDSGAQAGRYLLTGSAPSQDVQLHSGAGRIVSVRMRPLSMYERLRPKNAVSLAELLQGERSPISAETTTGLSDYVEEILAGGFPGLRRYTGRARIAQLDSYVSAIVEKDFPELGHVVRRPATLMAWLKAYAAATSTTASYNAILDAATPGESDKPARTTTIAYRDVLDRLRILDPVNGWVPTQNRFRKLMQAPKHHLADPALAAHLLGVNRGALLSGESEGPEIPRDGTLLGALFESLATLSVRVYAQSCDASIAHLRTIEGRREVDLIVERRDGTVVALEVKLGEAPTTSDVRHLVWLREQLGEQLRDAVVLTTGSHAYRRPDEIAVVPLALLGP